MSKWLVIGAAPSAPDGLQRARSGNAIDVIITTNGGIILEPTPNYYFISDTLACKIYQQPAREAAARGTVCLTLLRDKRAMLERGVEWMQAIPGGHPYEPFQLSGLWCAEHACRSGATELMLVGMDGYHSDPMQPHYFFNCPTPDLGVNVIGHTKKIIEPLTDKLVKKYPHVQWVLYGDPRFHLEAPNWKVR